MADPDLNAQILTHAAFNRPPVLNAPRRGPTPRGIPMLNRVRGQRGSEYWVLRKWADEHGVKPLAYSTIPHYDYDKVRELKAEHEARVAAERGLYGDELRDIAEMKQTLVKLYTAVNIREKRILEQATREIVNEIARENNLPVRYD
ncbi:hypothetical protein [Paraburkholderia sp. CI3]|uniref:hypothetical protein n=1 Tax=Paraburkholderia sp. CI3 TaxID=2991060 RepID=UPI003D1F67AE